MKKEEQLANSKKEPNDPGPSENNKTGEEDPPPVRVGQLHDSLTDQRARLGVLQEVAEQLCASLRDLARIDLIGT